MRILTIRAPYKQIADTMSIGIETIRTCIRRLYVKLHVHSRPAGWRRLAASGQTPVSLAPQTLPAEKNL